MMSTAFLLSLVVCLPVLIHAANNTTCRTASPPNTPTYSLSHPLPPQNTRLPRYLSFPYILRLLFGPTLAATKPRSRKLHLLIKPNGARCLVGIVAIRRHLSVFEIVRHDPTFFPVSLRHTLILARIRRSRLHLSFRVGDAQPADLRARNIFARALLLDMLDHARTALLLRSCSRALSSITGVCNNPRHPSRGATNTAQLRPSAPVVLRLFDNNMPNPREVSNRLCKTSRLIQHAPRGVNFLMVIFGQFLDHDIAHTPSGQARVEASFDVPDASQKKRKRMRFFRSNALGLPRCCEKDYAPPGVGPGPINDITAFVDGSVIYGPSHERALALRSFSNGELILKRRGQELLLPRNSKAHLPYTVENANRREDPALFAAGDIRGNENPILTSLHTIFAREHNRVCGLLRRELRRAGKPVQSDEWLYQQARRVTVAELQSVVFNEFVPAMLGPDALPPYTGYDEKLDASMGVLFTTAAFRWGHSAIREEILARTLSGKKRQYRLMDAFFNPKVFQSESVEAWLLGAMDAPAMNVDLQHADSVRDFLFSPGQRGRLDLVALNIQRGRDHQLPSYLAARQAYGLKRSLVDIEGGVRQRVVSVYGKAERIEAFVGGLAERKVNGSLLGPFFHAVVRDQFRRLRDGDRFYYQNVEWGQFLGRLGIVKRIRAGKVRLADILKANTRIKDSHIRSSMGAMAWK